MLGLLCVCCHFQNRNVRDILKEYVDDLVYRHHDHPDLSLAQVWHASDLWTLLRSARTDPQINTLGNPIHRVLESMGVKLSSYKLQRCRQPASSQSATHEKGGVQQQSGQPQSKRRAQPPRHEQHGDQQPSGQPKSKRLARPSRLPPRSGHKQRQPQSANKSVKEKLPEDHQPLANKSVKEELLEQHQPLAKELHKLEESRGQGVKGSGGTARPAEPQSQRKKQACSHSSSGTRSSSSSSYYSYYSSDEPLQGGIEKSAGQDGGIVQKNKQPPAPLQGGGVKRSAGQDGDTHSDARPLQAFKRPEPVVGKYEWRPGDWTCWTCGNLNYAERQQCNFRHCRMMWWKPGDWQCWNCGNHNFASRTTCNMRACKAPRP